MWFSSWCSATRYVRTFCVCFIKWNSSNPRIVMSLQQCISIYKWWYSAYHLIVIFCNTCNIYITVLYLIVLCILNDNMLHYNNVIRLLGALQALPTSLGTLQPQQARCTARSNIALFIIQARVIDVAIWQCVIHIYIISTAQWSIVKGKMPSRYVRTYMYVIALLKTS